MKKYENIKTGTKVGLTIVAVLMLITLFVAVMGLAQAEVRAQPYAVVQIISNILTILLILIYAFVAYRVPHGNMLRYVFVFFGILLVSKIILLGTPIKDEMMRLISHGLVGIAAVLIGYISGRLHKIDDNRVMMTLVGGMIALSCALVIISFPEFNIMRCISNFTQPLCWAALCLAYTARFEQHKSAGEK